MLAAAPEVTPRRVKTQFPIPDGSPPVRGSPSTHLAPRTQASGFFARPEKGVCVWGEGCGCLTCDRLGSRCQKKSSQSQEASFNFPHISFPRRKRSLRPSQLGGEARIGSTAASVAPFGRRPPFAEGAARPSLFTPRAAQQSRRRPGNSTQPALPVAPLQPGSLSAKRAVPSSQPSRFSPLSSPSTDSRSSRQAGEQAAESKLAKSRPAADSAAFPR